MDSSALLASAAKAASMAVRGPTVRAMVERGATQALDRADEAAASLGKGPRKVAQAALGELRKRLPDIADLGRDGLVLVAAHAAGEVWLSSSPEYTLDGALSASAAQTADLAQRQAARDRIVCAGLAITAAVGEAAARVALGMIVGAAR